MKKFIIGLVVGILVAPLTVLLYFISGSAPVATSDPMMPFEKLMAQTALHARLNKDMPKTVPLQADEAAYRAGALVYMHNCAVCHGVLNGPETPIAKGMFPPPPQLLEPDHGVTDDPPGETFWKVKNGIRLTGMPGFHASLSDEQAWQVSLLLANADKLPEGVKEQLTFSPPAAAPPAASPAPEKEPPK
jgi:thiosulfate dehydrogenase